MLYHHFLSHHVMHVMHIAHLCTLVTFAESFTFNSTVARRRLQVVFGFSPPATTDRCEFVSLVLYHSPDQGYLRGGPASDSIISPPSLRRPEAHILRIISAKFCSPVRKLLMERVNGQEGGNGLRRSKSSGITSGVAPNKTALALRIIFQS